MVKLMLDWSGFHRPAVLALGLALLGPAALVAPVGGDDAGTWTAVPLPIPHPLARAAHTLASYNGAGVLYGGQTPNPSGTGTIALSDLWAFKPSTGVFSRLNSTTPLPPPRYGHACTVQGIRMYAFFGQRTDGALLGDVWYYDFPRVCWEPFPSVGVRPAPRAEHSAVTQDADFILVFGGRAGNGSSLLDDLWRYEPFTCRWVQRASFPGGGRCGQVAVFLGGRMYVLGGTSPTGARNDVWAFDPKTNVWSELASDGAVPGPFTGSAGAVGDFERSGSQQIMIVGGRDAGGDAIGAAYSVSIDPNGRTAHWKQQQPHSAGFQSAATAVKPPSGSASAANLLLFGGSQAGRPTDTGWIFSKAGGATVGADLTATWGKVTAKASGRGAKRRWKLTGSLQVVNRGAVKAGASTLRIQLSADGSSHAGDRLLKQVRVRTLAPGKAFRSSWTATLPAGQTASGKYVVAVVDAAAKVAETDETNNTPAFGPIP